MELALKARNLGGTSPALRDPQQALDLLVRSTRDAAQKLGDQAAAGKLSPAEFGNRMSDLLEERHATAVFLGRAAAGDHTPLEPDDRKFAALIVDGEAEFLASFVEDLKGGRYAENPEAVGRRAALYGNRLAGSANEAAGLTSEPDAVVTWSLHAGESCDDCKRIEAGSPYTPETIPTWPGMCETSCLMNCACSTEVGGKPLFRVPD